MSLEKAARKGAEAARQAGGGTYDAGLRAARAAGFLSDDKIEAFARAFAGTPSAAVAPRAPRSVPASSSGGAFSWSRLPSRSSYASAGPGRHPTLYDPAETARIEAAYVHTPYRTPVTPSEHAAHAQEMALRTTYKTRSPRELALFLVGRDYVDEVVDAGNFCSLMGSGSGTDRAALQRARVADQFSREGTAVLDGVFASWRQHEFLSGGTAGLACVAAREARRAAEKKSPAFALGKKLTSAAFRKGLYDEHLDLPNENLPEGVIRTLFAQSGLPARDDDMFRAGVSAAFDAAQMRLG